VNVTITGLGQNLDFESGQTIHHALLLLPNGVQIQTRLDQESAAAILRALIGPEEEPAPPPPPPAPSPFGPVKITEKGEVFEFGGDQPAAAPPQPTPAVVPRRSRVVGKDSAGNPQVEFLDGSVSASDVVGNNPLVDEDGVSQL
jgi:hypothetical protein